MAKYSKIIIVVLVVFLFILGQKYKALRSENEDLSAENEDLSSLVDEYDYSLSEANDNIEEANSIIEDAQGYAWSSYEEMGEALDNLTTVDTVSAP